MSSELLYALGIAAFSIAVGAVIVAVVLWITLDIKNVIGFLSGKNAEKAIRALRDGKKGSTAYSMAKKPGDAPAPRYAGNSFSDEVVDKTMLINNGQGQESVSEETVSLDGETYALDNEPYVEAKAASDDDDNTCAIDNTDDAEGTIMIEPAEEKAAPANVFASEETVILTTEPDEIEFDI